MINLHAQLSYTSSQMQYAAYYTIAEEDLTIGGQGYTEMEKVVKRRRQRERVENRES